MELSILNTEGKETGKKVKLSKDIFGIEPNDHAIYLDVKQYLANQRQGTHKAKEKSEVSGSTRKLHRQKGTGGSRKGSIKNPLFRGGARVFGPRVRDYSQKLNKKVKELARKSALSYKAKDNNIIVVEDFNLDTPKTKKFQEILKNLKVDGKKNLLVIAKPDKNIYLSSRNLEKSKVTTLSQLNTYEIMNTGNLLMFVSSVKEIEKLF
jgi:large subunit ribosomal protein L4